MRSETEWVTNTRACSGNGRGVPLSHHTARVSLVNRKMSCEGALCEEERERDEAAPQAQAQREF